MAENTCKKCGNNLYGNKIKCPFCGEPIKGGSGYTSSTPTYNRPTPNTNNNYNNNNNYSNNNNNYNNNNYSNNKQSYSVDTGNGGWALLGFCIPIVGIVLYLVWKNEKPNTARVCLNGALVSIALRIFIQVVAACASAV